jgi:predicted transcriptional regulator
MIKTFSKLSIKACNIRYQFEKLERLNIEKFNLQIKYLEDKSLDNTKNLNDVLKKIERCTNHINKLVGV